MILYIGNYVNQGTSRGDALGFSLQYISSLKPLRGCEPDTNMITFLMETISKEFPDLEGIITDLAFIKSAKELKFKDLEDRLAKLGDAQRKAQEILERYQSFPPPPKASEKIDEQKDKFILTFKVRRRISPPCFIKGLIM